MNTQVNVNVVQFNTSLARSRSWINPWFRPRYHGFFGLMIYIVQVSVGVALLEFWALGWVLYGLFWIIREAVRETRPHAQRWLTQRRARRNA
jgi:hypothetical protein